MDFKIFIDFGNSMYLIEILKCSVKSDDIQSEF